MRFFSKIYAGVLAFVALSILIAAADSSLAATDKRVALIIGNSAYKNVTKLPNPSSDAAAIAALLKKSGFDVVESRQDLSINDMRRAVRDFSDKTRDADIAVVFYAGHGIEVDGSNYLVPVDAQLERDIDVEDEAMPLDRLIKVMEPVRRLRLVILDACRDNPFQKTMKRTMSSRSIGRGLGKVEVATSDTLIAFAAKAGSTASDGDGRNSPFTTALLDNIAVPGLDLRIAFGRVRDEVLRITGSKQEPFVYGSLGGTNVSLVAPLPEPVIAAPVPAPPVNFNAQAEMRRDYELAGQIGTKDAWDQFLSVYNTGLYAGLAKAARAKLLAEEAKLEAEAKAAVARAEAATKAAAAKSEAEAKAAIAKAEAEAKSAIAKADADAKAATKADADAKAAAAKSNIVVASAIPVDPPKPTIDMAQTVRSLQTELRRVGCYLGAAHGDYSNDTRKALELFNRHAGMRLDVKVASLDSVDVLKGKSTRVCPLQCEHGFKADGESCVKITCPSGQSVGDSNTCEAPKEKPRTASRPEPSRAAEDKPAAKPAAGPAQVVCGRNGCQEVKAGCKAVGVHQNGVSQNAVPTIVCN
jgi:uncharacterized caspase-like protein